jgi:S-DNA-T family DNA segregation ATPase FtsK/SpoIIIE
MPSTEAPPQRAPKIRKARKKAPKAAATPAPTRSHNVDMEAVGLVLLGIAVFLGAAMFLELRPLDGFKGAALGALGWGAYLLPVPFLVFGFLAFIRQRARLAARVMLGGAVVALAGLLATGLYAPQHAGSLVNSIAGPARAVLPLAVLGVVFIATLGLEIAFGWRRTTIARATAKGTSMLVSKTASLTGQAAMFAGATTQRIALQVSLRAQLESIGKDLAELLKIYPGSSELGSWADDVSDALEALGSSDENALTRTKENVSRWRSLIGGFTQGRAKDLAETLPGEDAGAEPLILEVQRLIASPVAGAGAGALALEGLRRTLQLDAKTLEDAGSRLKREREFALKSLSAAIRPADLHTELTHHTARAQGEKSLLVRAELLLGKATQFQPWTDFVARLEGKQEAEYLEFAQNLAGSLNNGGSDVLPELLQWSVDLDHLERDQAEKAQAAAAWWNQTPQAPQPVVSLTPTLETPPQPTVYEAVFELDFPGGNPLSGRDVAQLMHPSGLETTDVKLDDDAPWVSPSERAAQKVAAARLKENPKPNAPGIADSSVGERLRFDPSKAVGAIPIQVPGSSFLDPVQSSTIDFAAFDRDARARAKLMDETFQHFNVNAKVLDFARGPTVTRYEVEPAPGEKIARIASMQNDLARVLAVGGIRIEAPVPGKSVVGIEVPNREREPITFRTGIESQNFQKGKQKLPLLLGKSIDGEMVIEDLGRMPHLLIAGSTGSGKSVCVNTLIMSLLYRYLPTELRFVMVDPKMVELTPYDGIPHLVRPVVTNPADAAGVLLGCVAHMERRYKMMSEIQAKNLEQYNEKAKLEGLPTLPHMVIFIDELADLMITSPKEVESAIMRLAQMARATGMHLILATQRPSADVLTGLIKVNVPARIAFAVSSGIDSRTILDSMGAERLTGYGDMLFYRPGLPKAQRLQGPYISEKELERITEFLRKQYFDDDFGEKYGADFDGVLEGPAGVPMKAEDVDYGDPLLKKAAEVVIEESYAAVSRLQRRLSVGHSRAGKLIDMLEAMGIVGKHNGSKSRDVLITRDQLGEYFGRPD